MIYAGHVVEKWGEIDDFNKYYQKYKKYFQNDFNEAQYILAEEKNN